MRQPTRGGEARGTTREGNGAKAKTKKRIATTTTTATERVVTNKQGINSRSCHLRHRHCHSNHRDRHSPCMTSSCQTWSFTGKINNITLLIFIILLTNLSSRMSSSSTSSSSFSVIWTRTKKIASLRSTSSRSIRLSSSLPSSPSSILLSSKRRQNNRNPIVATSRRKRQEYGYGGEYQQGQRKTNGLLCRNVALSLKPSSSSYSSSSSSLSLNPSFLTILTPSAATGSSGTSTSWVIVLDEPVRHIIDNRHEDPEYQQTLKDRPLPSVLLLRGGDSSVLDGTDKMTTSREKYESWRSWPWSTRQQLPIRQRQPNGHQYVGGKRPFTSLLPNNNKDRKKRTSKKKGDGHDDDTKEDVGGYKNDEIENAPYSSSPSSSSSKTTIDDPSNRSRTSTAITKTTKTTRWTTKSATKWMEQKTRYFRRGLRQSIGGIFSGVGFVSSTMLSIATDPLSITERTRPPLKKLQNFLESSGIAQELLDTLYYDPTNKNNKNSISPYRLGLNLALLGRIHQVSQERRKQIEQKRLQQGRQQGHDVHGIVPRRKNNNKRRRDGGDYCKDGTDDEILFWEEATRYMRYATAVYGPAMIYSAQVESRGIRYFLSRWFFGSGKRQELKMNQLFNSGWDHYYDLYENSGTNKKNDDASQNDQLSKELISNHIGIPPEDIIWMDVNYNFDRTTGSSDNANGDNEDGDDVAIENESKERWRQPRRRGRRRRQNKNQQEQHSILRHFIAIDHEREKIVLAIRGTYSLSELVVDVTAFSEDFCCTTTSDGHGTSQQQAHAEMANMAKKLWQVAGPTIQEELLQEYPDYELIVTGHSLGAGAACLLTILLMHEQEEHHARQFLQSKNKNKNRKDHNHNHDHHTDNESPLDWKQKLSVGAKFNNDIDSLGNEKRLNHQADDDQYQYEKPMPKQIRCFAYASPPVFYQEKQQEEQRRRRRRHVFFGSCHRSPQQQGEDASKDGNTATDRAILATTNFIHGQDVIPYLSVDSVRRFVKTLKSIDDYTKHQQMISSKTTKDNKNDQPNSPTAPTTTTSNSLRTKNDWHIWKIICGFEVPSDELIEIVTGVKPIADVNDDNETNPSQNNNDMINKEQQPSFVMGAPPLEIPADQNVWMRPEYSLHEHGSDRDRDRDDDHDDDDDSINELYTYRVWNKEEFRNRQQRDGIQIHPDMFLDHFPSRYEQAMDQILYSMKKEKQTKKSK